MLLGTLVASRYGTAQGWWYRTQCWTGFLIPPYLLTKFEIHIYSQPTFEFRRVYSQNDLPNTMKDVA